MMIFTTHEFTIARKPLTLFGQLVFVYGQIIHSRGLIPENRGGMGMGMSFKAKRFVIKKVFDNFAFTQIKYISGKNLIKNEQLLVIAQLLNKSVVVKCMTKLFV